MTETANRSEALQQMRYLVSLLEGNAAFEQQVDSYLAARRALAECFRELAQEELASGGPDILDVKRWLTEYMDSRLSGRVPDDIFEVRGYTGVHQILLRYMARHVGEFAKAGRLRVLTGDQVHTERRVRELRDLGFTIEAKKVSAENQYCLHSEQPDIVFGARYQLRKNLEKRGYGEASIALLEGEL